ncbi:MAG: flagellar basal body P-ring formation chaperone FlgA [Pseudomonadota bacterium]
MSFIASAFWLTASLTGVSGLVASEVIPAGQTITLANVSSETATPEDANLIGREVARTVYKGQPIRYEQTRAKRLVTRNQIVTVKYINGGLEITTSGRAMSEAAHNETVTVLNLKSKQMVQGVVQAEGWVLAQ